MEAPATKLQIPLLRLYHQQPASRTLTAYNIVIGLELMDVSPTRLVESLRSAVAENPALRVVFGVGADGAFAQQILPPTHPLVVGKLDLSRESGGDASISPFTSPPWSVHLDGDRTAEGRQCLVLKFSHVVFDGASVEMLAKTLCRRYYANTRVEKTELGSQTERSYVEACLRLNSNSAGSGFDTEHLSKLAEFCRNLLQPDQHLLIEEAGAGRDGCGFTTRRYSRLNRSVGKVCAEHGVSPFTVLLHCLSAILRHRVSDFWAGFNFGVVKDVRAELGMGGDERMMGFFGNTLVG